MSNKISVTNTAIIISDYHMGDVPKLEQCFSNYDPIRHKFEFFGLYYDPDDKKLYLPGGIDLWKIKQYFDEKYYDRISSTPYKEIDNIMMKYGPRDEEQLEALKFSCGIENYADNAYLPQLSINLNTGKGKTYVSIATIAFFKIKSAIITGSNTLLSQWKDNILEYTNLSEDKIIQISGTPMINMILSGNSKKANDAYIYLISHGTIRSYADQYGWKKINELFIYLGIGMKFYDEAHTNYDNMMMIDFFTNIHKTYYVTATAARSAFNENKVFQLSIKNVPKIDLFKEADKHTAYCCIKWNSHPTPQQISACKNKYGLDRNKYINYVTKNPNFYSMMRIIMDMVLKCNGKVLMYIGTNEGILRVYHWIATEYNELIGDIGIFTSLLPHEEKVKQKEKRLILSTTKSAGLGEHINGLKMTIVVAEPFKSEVIARQTLGRTRDKNTLYIELVDLGFIYIKKFYNAKLEVFNKYATDVSDSFIDNYELNRRCQAIISKRKAKSEGKIQPIHFKDDRFDFTNIENNKQYFEKEDEEESNNINSKFKLSKNPYIE